MKEMKKSKKVMLNGQRDALDNFVFTDYFSFSMQKKKSLNFITHSSSTPETFLPLCNKKLL